MGRPPKNQNADVEEVKKTSDAPEIPRRDVAAKAKPPRVAGPVIYVGPPVKGTILHSTFTIFADGVPKEYRENPTFKNLFVPPETLDKAREEIGRKGSLRNTCYLRAVEETKRKD